MLASPPRNGGERCAGSEIFTSPHGTCARGAPCPRHPDTVVGLIVLPRACACSPVVVCRGGSACVKVVVSRRSARQGTLKFVKSIIASVCVLRGEKGTQQGAARACMNAVGGDVARRTRHHRLQRFGNGHVTVT